MRLPQRICTVAVLAAALLVAAPGCDSEGNGGDEPQSTADESSGDDGPDEVVFAFQPQENPEGLRPDANRLAEFMTERIGAKAKVFLPTSYAAVVEALRAGNADVAYFGGWPYLIASRKADVDLLVVEERYDNPYYHSEWYVDADSDIESVADLEGRNVAFISPTSASGYLFPWAKVIEETSMQKGDDPKSFFSEVVFAGGYQQALQSLVHDRVDAAAASEYALELYVDDDERENIRILSRQGPVPTHGVAVRSTLPDKTKSAIREAFLDLNSDENKDLLTSLYGADKLLEQSHDDHVAPLKEALVTTGEERDIEGFGAGSGSGHGSGEGSGEEAGSGQEAGSGADEGAAGGDDESGSGAGSGEGSGADHEEDETSDSPGAGSGSHAGSGSPD